MQNNTNKGYTLLELMVVLAIIGLMISIATPRLITMYNATQFSLEKDDIAFQLSLLPTKVYLKGKNLSLKEIMEERSGAFLSLPPDWQVLNPDSIASIKYSQFGFCNGGELQLARNERPFILQLTPPLCKPQVIQ
jgi:prepilin-type N-terminal cleavage/methylation domain-containing protein